MSIQHPRHRQGPRRRQRGRRPVLAQRGLRAARQVGVALGQGREIGGRQVDPEGLVGAAGAKGEPGGPAGAEEQIGETGTVADRLGQPLHPDRRRPPQPQVEHDERLLGRALGGQVLARDVPAAHDRHAGHGEAMRAHPHHRVLEAAPHVPHAVGLRRVRSRVQQRPEVPRCQSRLHVSPSVPVPSGKGYAEGRSRSRPRCACRRHLPGTTLLVPGETGPALRPRAPQRGSSRGSRGRRRMGSGPARRDGLRLHLGGDQ